jgi:uncharacterized protein (DUF1499 family)
MKPIINDITTSFDSPPQFVKIALLFPNRDFSYPKHFRIKQEAYYKNLNPLIMETDLENTLKAVWKLAEEQKNWKIIDVDEKEFRIEATAVTPLMRFKDDIVIEVRKERNKTTIHMRSKSRLGKGDLGANANRILHFFSCLC